MNKTLRDMLIGVILGDAHIRRTGLGQAYITFEQSKKKMDYFNYLYNLAREEDITLGITLGEPKLH